MHRSSPFFAAILLVGCHTASEIATPLPTETAPTEPAPPAPLDRAACKSEHARDWQPGAPACKGARTCVDARGRFWVEGKPFFLRGVYSGGWEYTKVVANCPEGAPCRAYNPTDARSFVTMLANAGFNVIQERSRYNAAVLDAVHAEPRMKFAHLLWSDPFTKEGHDAMEADIRAAAADPSVVMWFGPDEIDLNDDYATAAGIRRILRGASDATNALVRDFPSKAGAGAYLPADQTATDPLGLPFGAALAFERGLGVGARFYDLLMPITYPFTSATAAANAGSWGTWRASKYAGKLPQVPILQMAAIAEMDLVQPTPSQIKAQIASSIVNGAAAAFYFSITGDNPKLAGRQGWFAPDDREGWAAFTEMHALEDELTSVLFAEATETAHFGEEEKLEWRTWRRPDGRRVTLVANPRSKRTNADLTSILGLAEGETVRSWGDCATIDASAALTLEGYAFQVLETIPAR